jgi:hypothetical protein
MHAGKRWRMRVDEFAFARATRHHVEAGRRARREPHFVAEVMAAAIRVRGR